MFICKECLERDYTNSPGFFVSLGNCEICGNTAGCSDIKSSLLVLKTPISEQAITLYDEYNPAGDNEIQKLVNLLRIWRNEGHLQVDKGFREDKVSAVLNKIELENKALQPNTDF